MKMGTEESCHEEKRKKKEETGKHVISLIISASMLILMVREYSGNHESTVLLFPGRAPKRTI